MSLSGWIFFGIVYVLGLGTGWLLWRRSKVNAAAAETDVEVLSSPGTPPSPEKLAAFEKELENAKAMLEAEAEDREDLDSALSALDDAIKRANGRLKLVMKSMKSDSSND